MAVNGTFHILPVSDMDRAIAFWRDTVGCAERFSTPTFSEVDAGGSVICLRSSKNPGGRTALGVDVSDLEATCRAIASSGGEVLRDAAPGPVPGLLTALATDADGNRFELTEHQPS